MLEFFFGRVLIVRLKQVPDGYDGPRLRDDAAISDDFVQQALECFARHGAYEGSSPPEEENGGKIGMALSAPPTTPPPAPKSPKRFYFSKLF